MKQSLKLLLLIQLMITHPSYAAVLGGDGTPLPLPPPKTNTPPPSSSNTNAQPAGKPISVTTIQQPKIQGQIPTELTTLTPEQSQQLINQTKNLKPEQLQAIAKSLSTQAAQGSAQSQLQAKIKQLDPDAGLIEEVTPIKPNQAEVLVKPSPGEMKRQQAFNILMEEALPLSPDQIKDLHRFYDMTLQAKAATPAPPPTPNFTSIIVNLDPGSQPPVIRLAAGFVTSVLFVDSTGAAWPITAYSIGDPQNFNIQWDQKGNALFIQSLKQYAHGNLAVRLWGLDTPVMLTLVSGQRNVDFRVDLQVIGRGPDAKPPVVDTTFNAKVNPLLINILDGIPPRDSIKLSVTGGHGEAWLADNRVYFRTKLTVLSPAWTATVSSADGTHVYELMLTPFILASENGKTIDIKLSGL
ncbi:MAG: type IV secretion protein IcmK [Proteobacteria bacterium]|nr:type IV secretion protein IcmK [Pseudomonadota bacterium]